MAKGPKRSSGLGPFLDALAKMLAETPAGDRKIVAIAGPPASGKSTTCLQIAEWLEKEAPGEGAIVGMDGFHLDDAVLKPRGWHHQKGAPHTFDVGGLNATIERIRRNDEAYVAVPRFDRATEASRAAAWVVEQRARLVVIEGNYLLSQDAGWSTLSQYFDVTAMLSVPEVTLERRLIERWLAHGYTRQEAESKANDNDLVNARYVMANSSEPDWIIEFGTDSHSTDSHSTDGPGAVGPAQR